MIQKIMMSFSKVDDVDQYILTLLDMISVVRVAGINHATYQLVKQYPIYQELMIYSADVCAHRRSFSRGTMIYHFYRLNLSHLIKHYQLYDPEGFSLAAKHNNLDLMDWLKKSGYHYKYTVNLVDSASQLGHVSVLEWFKNDVLSMGNVLLYHGAIRMASCYGQVHVLDWFFANSQFVHSCWDEQNDRVGVLEWLEVSKQHGMTAIDEAASQGHIGVLDWFINRPNIPFNYTTYAIDMAAGNGHTAVIEWFLSHAQLEFRYTINAINFAAGSGHLEILELFAKTNLEFKYSAGAIDCAAMNGHLHIITWFIDRFGSETKYANAFSWAKKYKYTEILRIMRKLKHDRRMAKRKNRVARIWLLF